MAGLPCPHCYHARTIVADSRTSQEPFFTVRRRRKCPECNFQWNTFEVADDMVAKMRSVARAMHALRRIDIHELEEEDALS